MSEASNDGIAIASNPLARARKMQSELLQRLAGNQIQIATAKGVSESTVSRSKEHIGDVMELAAFSGMKLVPVEMQCFDESEVLAFETLAEKYLQLKKQMRESLQ